MSDERIETENVRAPSEIRDYDWRAWFEDDRSLGVTGWGATERAAIADLKAKRDKPVPQPAPIALDRAAFSNVLWVMTSLDRHELEQAGVLPIGDHNAWGTFKRDPFRWYIRADDAAAGKMFALVMQRAAKS